MLVATHYTVSLDIGKGVYVVRNKDAPMCPECGVLMSGYENSLARSIDMQSLPVDKESRYSLVRVDEPVETLDPVLDEYTRAQLDDFRLL